MEEKPKGKPRGRKGGRPKGSRNQRTKKILNRAETTGLLPGEILLAVARGEDILGRPPTFEERVDAAKAAAPYYQPKLQSVEQKIEQTTKKKISAEPLSDEEWGAQYARGSEGEEPATH